MCLCLLHHPTGSVEGFAPAGIDLFWDLQREVIMKRKHGLFFYFVRHGLDFLCYRVLESYHTRPWLANTGGKISLFACLGSLLISFCCCLRACWTQSLW